MLLLALLVDLRTLWFVVCNFPGLHVGVSLGFFCCYLFGCLLVLNGVVVDCGLRCFDLIRLFVYLCSTGCGLRCFGFACWFCCFRLT